MPAPLVVFDNVVKRFGTFEAVKRMNFEINEGEFLAFMGPSGCGKTTTLRMLAGLEAPTEGDIRLAGQSLLGVKPHERDTPMVWQSLALFQSDVTGGCRITPGPRTGSQRSGAM